MSARKPWPHTSSLPGVGGFHWKPAPCSALDEALARNEFDDLVCVRQPATEELSKSSAPTGVALGCGRFPRFVSRSDPSQMQGRAPICADGDLWVP